MTAFYNTLSPNGFIFNISRIPLVNFFCQTANLPRIMLGEAEMSNPLSNIGIPGDKLTFEPLNIQFMVDENMENYLQIFDWMMALGFPRNHDQYKDFINQQTPEQLILLDELSKNFSDASLQILNSKNNVVKTVKYVNVFPVALDGLSFASTNEDVIHLVANATFRYTYFYFDS